MFWIPTAAVNVTGFALPPNEDTVLNVAESVGVLGNAAHQLAVSFQVKLTAVADQVALAP